MIGKLHRVFVLAEKEREALLNKVSRASDHTLFFKPGNRWSIGEILHHLITAERISLTYMKKKSLTLDSLETTGFKEELKSLLLTASQRLPFKYKAPLVLKEYPIEQLPFMEIKTAWNSVRAELEVFLNQFDESTYRKKVYKHPVAGKLNVLQAVSFMREHVNHHQPQINRLI